MSLHVFPIPIPRSHLPLHPLPPGLPRAPGPSACLMHPTWAGDLFQENFVCGLRGRILHGLPLTGIPLLSMKSLLHSSPLKLKNLKTFSSVQSLSCVRLFATPWTLHARPPCPSPTTIAYSNSCPLSLGCPPTISFSVVPFSSCLQSFPASGSFQLSQFFTSGGQVLEPQLQHHSF